MAIEYRVIPRKILGGEDKGKTKYYATASNTGRTDLDALTRDIERSSTVSGADIRAVLYALEAGNTITASRVAKDKHAQATDSSTPGITKKPVKAFPDNEDIRIETSTYVFYSYTGILCGQFLFCDDTRVYGLCFSLLHLLIVDLSLFRLQNFP